MRSILTWRREKERSTNPAGGKWTSTYLLRQCIIGLLACQPGEIRVLTVLEWCDTIRNVVSVRSLTTIPQVALCGVLREGMVPKSKLSGPDRKNSIVQAARTIFAENGFNATSIKAIARAAGVSEALIYKHFSGKQELYAEVLRFSRDVGAVHLRELATLGPGTEALVFYVFLMVETILFEVPGRAVDQKAHEMFLFRSLIGDTKYARRALGTVEKNLADDLILASFEAAAKAGDLVESPISRKDRMWLVHHLAMALNLCSLSGIPTCKYDAPMPSLAEHVVLFCLRGIGLTDDAIRRYYEPDKLRAQMMRLHEGLSGS